MICFRLDQVKYRYFLLFDFIVNNFVFVFHYFFSIALPCDKIENESTHVAMLITKRGGHIGFMDGLWPLSKTSRPYYLERLAKQYLLAFYHQMDKSFLLENF